MKCRFIAPLAENLKHDAEFINKIRGTQWKPSVNHNGWMIHTNLKPSEDDEDALEDNDPYEVPADIRRVYEA